LSSLTRIYWVIDTAPIKVRDTQFVTANSPVYNSPYTVTSYAEWNVYTITTGVLCPEICKNLQKQAKL